MLKALRAAAGMGVLLLLGCINGPYNGSTHGAAITGASFQVQGFHISPNTAVDVQVLSAPTADPTVDANWTTIGTAISSSTAQVWNGDSLYPWSTTVVPVPTVFQSARWPYGGLVKIRAMAHSSSGGSPNPAYTFDDVAWSDCAMAQYGAGTPGEQIGINCQGLGHTVLSMVHTLNNPADLGTRDFLGLKSDSTDAQTNSYYGSWGAPSDLNGFKTQYQYPGTGDVTATYYNDSDLGVGREMHCWQYNRSAGGQSLTGTACFVSNYSDTSGTAKFGNNNVDTALSNAIAHAGAFATVAMVTEKPVGSGTPGAVNFIAFTGTSGRVTQAQLDNKNLHRSIPNNCLACHGMDSFFDPSTSTIGPRANFLPFDLAGYRYSSQSNFTRAAQEESFRRLNKMVRDATSPNPGITTVINGAYSPSGVATAGATWNDSWIPSGWQVGSNQDYPTLYKGVVRPYCRTCHQTGLSFHDFGESTDFDNLKSTIAAYACQTPNGASFMPQAEHPMRRFWASGARAYLNAWTGDTTGCKP